MYFILQRSKDFLSKLKLIDMTLYTYNDIIDNIVLYAIESMFISDSTLRI